MRGQCCSVLLFFLLFHRYLIFLITINKNVITKKRLLSTCRFLVYSNSVGMQRCIFFSCDCV